MFVHDVHERTIESISRGVTTKRTAGSLTGLRSSSKLAGLSSTGWLSAASLARGSRACSDTDGGWRSGSSPTASEERVRLR
jgi:hypothetical protein